MSSSANTPTSTSSASPSASTTGIFSGSTGGVSSSLYLFTFLITIVVLGIISAALLLRAYYVRRQFQLRVEEAIRRGQPLPQDAVRALGLNRRKKGKDVGKMPTFWEAEMWRDGAKAEKWGTGKWNDIVPLALVHFPTNDLPPPQPEISLENFPQRRGPFFLRPFLVPRPPDNFLEHPPTRGERPSASRGDSNSMQPADTAYAVPEDGAAVTVGVMIALPVEEGKGLEKWTAEEEEGEVPEVCLGVLECTVKGGD